LIGLLSFFFHISIAALKYWHERRNVNYHNADTAVWNDDAVHGALESAAFWSKGLPYAKSLSGYWKFLLSPSAESIPERFYDAQFDDSNWSALPGTVLELPSTFLTCFLAENVLVV
jgi:hypothetical protein